MFTDQKSRLKIVEDKQLASKDIVAFAPEKVMTIKNTENGLKLFTDSMFYYVGMKHVYLYNYTEEKFTDSNGVNMSTIYCHRYIMPKVSESFSAKDGMLKIQSDIARFIFEDHFRG